MTGRIVLLAGLALLPPVVASPQDHALPPAAAIDRTALPAAVNDVEGVEAHLARDGRVFVGGQPSEPALVRLKELGVTLVVNLRTPKETEDRTTVPYDEAAAAARLGLAYVSDPVGGKDHPFSPAVVERFAAALEQHGGNVFLHCATGHRASLVWAAYLIRYGGLDLDAALARGRAIAIAPDPLGELLGRPVRLVWDEAPPPAATAAPR